MTASGETAGGNPPPRWRPVDVCLLVAVCAIALVTYVTYRGLTPSFDESWHLAMTLGNGSPVGRLPHDAWSPSLPALTSLDSNAAPWWHVWTHLGGIPHPPLYFLLLRGWRTVFGDGFAAAQWLSILASVVGVGFTFAVARLAMDRWAAALVGLTLGIAQAQNYLAQELRPYALSIALSAGAIYAMTLIEVRGATRARAVGLAALTLPLMLTHYFNLAVAIAIGIYAIIRLRRAPRRAFLITAMLAAFVFCIAWGPFALAQSRNLGPADDFLRARSHDLGSEVLYTCVAPMRLIVDRDHRAAPWTLIGGALFVAPWLLVRRFPAILPWALWLTLGIGFIAAFDLAAMRTHLWMIRYAASASPAVPLVFIGIAWALDRRLSYAAGVTLALAGGMYLFSAGGTTSDCSDFTATFRAIAERARPGDAVIAYHGEAPAFYGDIAILSASREPTLVGRPFAIIDGPVDFDVPAPRVWLITGRSPLRPEQIVPGGQVIDHVTRDLELSAYLLEMHPTPTSNSAQTSTQPEARP